VTEPLELVDLAVGRAGAGEDVEAVVHLERSGLARYAGTEVHQPTLIDNCTLQVSVVRGGALGTASTNRVDEAGVAAAVERAREAAANRHPDAAFAGLAGPAELPEVEGYDEQTAELGADALARAAAAVIDGCAPLGAYGYVTSGLCELAVGSTTGLRSSQRFTDVTVRVLAAADGCSGFADSTAWAIGSVDPGAVAQEARAKAERTREAASIEPRAYRAVLEPYAFGELLQWFSWEAFSGLALLEERSAVTGRLGQPWVDAKVSIADDALTARNLPKAFDFEGTPKERVVLVEEGVARGVVWDRASAAQAGGGQRSTGHALPLAERHWGPLPLALEVAPGEAESTEELAELVGDGIYVTRFHYLGIVDPREGILTGMTKDGTFRIRDGRVAEPLVNLRFTVSVPELLADVPGLGREQKLVNQSDFYDERYPQAALVPAIATARFNVTGTGAAPGL
jgi:predicted Zn-dependent protease